MLKRFKMALKEWKQTIRWYPIAIFWTIKEFKLPFLFKYYLFSHFPPWKDLFISHFPIVLGYKNHIFQNIIFAGQKKRTDIYLFNHTTKYKYWANERDKQRFFVISQRVKQIFAVYCKYAKNSKKSGFLYILSVSL